MCQFFSFFNFDFSIYLELVTRLILILIVILIADYLNVHVGLALFITT